ncbi:phage holin family protein [Pseudomonas sp. PSKL.D1]|uniref:phage holin family protein n=1 Tax=Pseudomonas sp. PSKL.D1 TaxID=3029060 RepID=UPI002380DE0A|nr:phage holin family protein [Pseudomonas sp. PSKL.D1]WDY60381.1 phage holin family protein [Pseudomonas sp. PSKL.D1]
MTTLVSIAQAIFCGGLCFVIAFLYKRGDSRYKFMPSLCAFGLASLFGQQWLSLIARALYTGAWPEVSPYNTMIFGILFLLVVRARGNVARIFELRKKG